MIQNSRPDAKSTLSAPGSLALNRLGGPGFGASIA